jgi:hypothetical protein
MTELRQRQHCATLHDFAHAGIERNLPANRDRTLRHIATRRERIQCKASPEHYAIP